VAAEEGVERAVEMDLDGGAVCLRDGDLVAVAGDVGLTSPAVPLPTSARAAAFAFSAASPLTGFSSASWAAVPCAGYACRGGALALGVVMVAVVLVLAAFAMTAPPAAKAAIAATVAKSLHMLLVTFIQPTAAQWTQTPGHARSHGGATFL
jgi:hypothetical protein